MKNAPVANRSPARDALTFLMQSADRHAMKRVTLEHHTSPSAVQAALSEKLLELHPNEKWLTYSSHGAEVWGQLQKRRARARTRIKLDLPYERILSRAEVAVELLTRAQRGQASGEVRAAFRALAAELLGPFQNFPCPEGYQVRQDALRDLLETLV